jgi:hypothetical protein
MKSDELHAEELKAMRERLSRHDKRARKIIRQLAPKKPAKKRVKPRLRPKTRKKQPLNAPSISFNMANIENARSLLRRFCQVNCCPKRIGHHYLCGYRMWDDDGTLHG